MLIKYKKTVFLLLICIIVVGNYFISYKPYIIIYNLIIYSIFFYFTNVLIKNFVKLKSHMETMELDFLIFEKEKKNFIIKVGHDLKAPFAAIQNYVQIVLEGFVGNIDPKVRDIMDKVLLKCKSISEMIKNVNILSSLRNSTKLNETFTNIDPVPIFEKKIMYLVESAKVKNIDVKFINELELQPVTIKLNANLLEILLDALLSNAINYSREGTQIVVTIYKEASHNSLCFSISDQGIGIPDEDFDKIFLECFRGNNAKKIKSDGHGLGLTIAKEIIDIYSGKINIESKLNVGTKFTIEIPQNKFAKEK